MRIEMYLHIGLLLNRGSKRNVVPSREVGGLGDDAVLEACGERSGERYIKINATRRTNTNGCDIGEGEVGLDEGLLAGIDESINNRLKLVVLETRRSMSNEVSFFVYNTSLGVGGAEVDADEVFGLLGLDFLLGAAMLLGKEFVSENSSDNSSGSDSELLHVLGVELGHICTVICEG